MKIKTSRNFNLVVDILKNQGYSTHKAAEIARKIFADVKVNKDKTVEDYLIEYCEENF